MRRAPDIALVTLRWIVVIVAVLAWLLAVPLVGLVSGLVARIRRLATVLFER
jgi:hypothetical protein